MKQPTILVVDDSEEIQRAMELALEGQARYLKALTLKEASALATRYWGDLDAVLMDGSVPPGDLGHGLGLTPEEWVRRMRGFFSHLDIIAFSANPSSQKRLMEAGCNMQFAKGEESINYLLGLLNIPT